MRRLALLACSTLVVLATTFWPAPEVAASRVTPAAVTWSVDQNAKLITGEVRIRIRPHCTASMLAGRARNPVLRQRCTVSPEVAAAIRANAERLWNNGYKYQCYDVQIVVDVQIDNDPSGTPSDDRVDVSIDQASSNVRSSIRTVGPVGSAWNSGRYEDRAQPVNDTDQPSVLAYPPPRDIDANLYAHEIGHVMGLEDGYEDARDPSGNEFSRPRPDAPDDLMTHQGNPLVHQSTIDLLINRSGVFNTEKVKCDYKIDTMINWYHFEALKCGSPEGAWNILVSGIFDLGGASLVLSGNGTATLTRTGSTIYTGPWDAGFQINLEGVPASIGGQAGTITGDATYDAGQLSLNGTNAQGNFWAQTPALSLGGSTDPLKSFTLPVENDQFC